MIPKSFLRLSLIATLLLPLATYAQRNRGVAVWMTTADRSSLLARQADLLPASKPQAGIPTIAVNSGRKYQIVEGFGFALTSGSAELLMKMAEPERSAMLRQIFSTDGGGIGVSYIRITIGASDMNADVYSYDDLAPGDTDPDLKNFSLAHDEAAMIPILKEILAINPKLKILGSPWSAPSWMKTNDAPKGGNLKPEYYKTYANYFVKYIRDMKAHGIRIDAVTVQNEPLNPKNTPSMVMFANEEGQFIKTALGPAFRKAGIKTKILVYDHNADVTSYALSILGDPIASQYVAGSAWHLYGGEISALTRVHDAFPNKGIYFTEQTVTGSVDTPEINIAAPVSQILIGATRNWSRNVLLWNLAADPNNGPHTNNGGCTMCQGAVTLNGNQARINVAYYVVAHFSKFVPSGSVRIDSNDEEQLANVAFLTPQGKMVLVVSNTGNFLKTFNISYQSQTIIATLPPESVATYIW